MSRFFERIAKIGKTRPFSVINIAIFSWYAIFMGILLAVLLTDNVPPELTTAKGTIVSIKHHDRTDPDALEYITNDTSSYLDVKLSDGGAYRAIGIRYDNIDRELFDVLNVGSEIKLIYEDRGFGGGIDIIYGIEYYGKTYLSSDDALSDLKSERKITVITCSVIIGALTILAGVGVFFNYRKFKRKPKDNAEL